MRRKKILKKANHDAMVDMDDFLVTYGAEKLGAEKKNLSQTIYNAGKSNLTGLDKLFNDKGFGRKQKFESIARGFVNDWYNMSDDKTNQMAMDLSKRAFRYLGEHADQFNHWKQA